MLEFIMKWIDAEQNQNDREILVQFVQKILDYPAIIQHSTYENIEANKVFILLQLNFSIDVV